MVNNQPHSGLFTMADFPVLKGDTGRTLAARLARAEKAAAKGKVREPEGYCFC